jgi:hypothetical protein
MSPRNFAQQNGRGIGLLKEWSAQSVSEEGVQDLRSLYRGREENKGENEGTQKYAQRRLERRIE